MNNYVNERIIHLCTYPDGGAGDFAANINKAFTKLGVNSMILNKFSYAHRKHLVINTIPFPRILRIKLRYFARKLFNYFGLIDSKYAFFGIEFTAFGLYRRKIFNRIIAFDPSVILVYWISEFLSFYDLVELQSFLPNVKFVFICLDESLLTAGCHYSNACTSLSRGCHNCPATTSKIAKILIEQNLSRRSFMTSRISPLFVCPSSQYVQTLQSSPIASKSRNSVIHLGCFTEGEYSELIKAKQMIHQSNNASPINILIRSSSEKRKGLHILMNALSEIKPYLLKKCNFIFIGDTSLFQYSVIPNLSIDYRGFVSRQELLTIYRSIDLFLMPSLADSGPLMVNEVWSLGIQIISHPIGVALDFHRLTPNQITLVDYLSVNSWSQNLSELIIKFKSDAIRNPPPSNQILTFENYAQKLFELT